MHTSPSKRLEAILDADQTAVEALAAIDIETWETLFRHALLARDSFAPSPLVRAMRDREPSLRQWLAWAKEAAGQVDIGDITVTISGVMRGFEPWLLKGLARSDADDPELLFEVRLWRLWKSPGFGQELAEEALCLVGEALQRWGRTLQLGQLLVLASRRAYEENAIEDALAAIEAAQALFEDHGEENEATNALRQRGAILLTLRRFDEAFALLDPLLESRGNLFFGGGAFRSSDSTDLRLSATLEASDVAKWAAHITPEWVRALGGMATHFSNRRLGSTEHGAMLWARFERALVRMLRESKYGNDDLEVVVRQANQRRLRKVASEAKRIATALRTETYEAPEPELSTQTPPSLPDPNPFFERARTVMNSTSCNAKALWADILGPAWDDTDVDRS